MADFKGLKMRAPTRQTNKLLGALGATPVAMPLPALADALSKGVVDGYLLPWEVIPSIKAHELTKYHSETDPKARALYTAVFTLQMNQAKYDSLPADLKKVIDANSGAAVSRAFGKQWDASAPPARKLAVDRNNTFYVIPASELANWEKATANLDDDWVKDVTAKGNDGKALLQFARDLDQEVRGEVAARPRQDGRGRPAPAALPADPARTGVDADLPRRAIECVERGGEACPSNR